MVASKLLLLAAFVAVASANVAPPPNPVDKLPFLKSATAEQKAAFEALYKEDLPLSELKTKAEALAAQYGGEIQAGFEKFETTFQDGKAKAIAYLQGSEIPEATKAQAVKLVALLQNEALTVGEFHKQAKEIFESLDQAVRDKIKANLQDLIPKDA